MNKTGLGILEGDLMPFVAKRLVEGRSRGHQGGPTQITACFTHQFGPLLLEVCPSLEPTHTGFVCLSISLSPKMQGESLGSKLPTCPCVLPLAWDRWCQPTLQMGKLRLRDSGRCDPLGIGTCWTIEITGFSSLP